MNPYGINLYGEVLTFSSNENLTSLVEWEPLTLRMKQGRAAAVAALTIIVAYRISPRRISMTEILLLAGLGLGAPLVFEADRLVGARGGVLFRSACQRVVATAAI